MGAGGDCKPFSAAAAAKKSTMPRWETRKARTDEPLRTSEATAATSIRTAASATFLGMDVFTPGHRTRPAVPAQVSPSSGSHLTSAGSSAK